MLKGDSAELVKPPVVLAQQTAPEVKAAATPWRHPSSPASQVLEKRAPEPLTQAALEVLAVVAYEQPVTRAVISHIRGTDSTGVVDTLLERGFIADDPRFGGRGRPSFLVTTERFLQLFGLGSLAELPPRPAASIS